MQSSSARVLIVDDERPVREMLREFLTIQGYEVSTAATGTEGLDAVPSFQPDVILLDRTMPGLSGPEVLSALSRAGIGIPVILISGTEATRREGFFDVLSKPFDLPRLAEVVTAALVYGRRESA
jgi:CheY-like chemotaxis protein